MTKLVDKLNEENVIEIMAVVIVQTDEGREAHTQYSGTIDRFRTIGLLECLKTDLMEN